MIKGIGPDIIAFQEVRQNTDVVKSQLQDIQTLVPWLKYEAFTVVQKVTHKSDAYHTEWAYEGLGLLSQYPVTVDVQNLTHRSGQDKNHRAVLHCTVQHPVVGDILVSVVHLSYDKQQQCSNVMEINQYLKSRNVQNQIVLGDFNVYNTFPWPVRLFLNHDDKEALQKCVVHRLLNQLKHTNSADKNHFVDVWTETNPDKDGFTFSNMPVPGLESRPDRIYASKNISALSAAHIGDGSVYRSRFYFHVFWHRVSSVLSAMQDSKKGLSGRACLHDCGPHASCRCGICVAGGDKNSCNTPNCPGCDSTTLNLFIIFVILAIVFVIQLLYGTLQVLQAMNNRQVEEWTHTSCISLPFCDWLCLCDLVFYTQSRELPRTTHRSRPRRSIIARYWPVLRLPPMLLVLVTLCLGCFYVQAFIMVFGNVMQDIYAVIPEELFPSDHLMLSATLKLGGRD